LQANVKTREGPQHPDSGCRVPLFEPSGQSIPARRKPRGFGGHTKKKELVGAFKNAGRRWLPQGKAEEVTMHDFPHLGHGKAIPYGAYDIARNRSRQCRYNARDGGIRGREHPALVATGWQTSLPGTGRLLICADSGGSNGNRQRAWKVHLQALSDETGMAITVCHYPPGT
jgi:hypothetical protein